MQSNNHIILYLSTINTIINSFTLDNTFTKTLSSAYTKTQYNTGVLLKFALKYVVQKHSCLIFRIHIYYRQQRHPQQIEFR